MKDDEWGETDVLMMLPDSSEVESRAANTKESSSMSQKTQASSCKVETIAEFGDYQPSILSSSGPKKSPIAGRRSSPEKGHVPRSAASTAVKTTYIKLKRETETVEKLLEPEINFERPHSAEESSGLMNAESINKAKDDEEKPLVSRRIESAPPVFDSNRTEGAQLLTDHLQTHDQSLLGK